MKKVLKILLITFISLVALVLLIFLISEWTITRGSNKYIYDSVEDVPTNQIVLVLGTAKRLSGNRENMFYTYRIEAAKELYNAGKVRAFVVSGDNRRHYYNEPLTMQNSLMEAGVPKEMIYLDYAGFRTLDSVIRVSKIFGQDSFIVVSQKFHIQRAIYIARRNGLEAYGYAAQDVPLNRSFRTFIRERFARVKVFIDILTKKEPKFLGEPVEIKTNVDE
ncbi:hypothetical protein D0T49_07515 [Paludibacter sp. 221]|uniref:SanA/YdcF family protein n=1 Tax=Paludibacter sp. 221 TaxID=2302939 RepID=UPI0013D0FDEE|nr:ElyC/SanA/YdcF family protein [Paludibacter sp. 221]NDV46893.1 hypothetical protein [Paludibacter sp. 221]